MKTIRTIAVLLFAAAAVRAEEIPLQFSEFSIARTRLEKKVWADSKIKNTGTGLVTGVSLSLICYEAEREVARSRAIEIDSIPPGGGEAPVSFEIVKCPFFTAYVVDASWFAGGKEQKARFIGRDLFNPPVPERKGAIPGVAYLEVYGLKYERADKDISLNFTVKNAGELPADMARVRFKFYDVDHNLLREEARAFGEKFESLKEVPLTVKIKDVPEFDKVRADIEESSTEERNLAEGEFTGEAEVEAAAFRFEDRQDGSIRVSGRVRNGKPVGVRNVVIKIMLFNRGTQVREVMATPERALRPGETSSFLTTLKNPPEFDDYKYTPSYEEDETLVAGDPPKVPEPKVADPKDPVAPADPKVPTPKPVDPKPVKPEDPKFKSIAQAVTVRGSRWIAGDWVGEGKQSKYRGAFLVLSVQFTDKNGKTAKVAQGGTIELTFKAPAKKDLVTRLKVEKFAWSTDSRKFTVSNSKPGMMGYDPDSEALDIVIIEFKDNSDWNFTLDLKFTSDENEVWEWKGLSEPYRSEATKPTGKKK
ncbi:MAG: FxLYD domain-containing protein [Planctomycetes bacterium]|nr:FxLYD domain-containing protein [Planctomycetota bacterium]